MGEILKYLSNKTLPYIRENPLSGSAACCTWSVGDSGHSQPSRCSLGLDHAFCYVPVVVFMVSVNRRSHLCLLCLFGIVRWQRAGSHHVGRKVMAVRLARLFLFVGVEIRPRPEFMCDACHMPVCRGRPLWSTLELANQWIRRNIHLLS